MTRIIDALFGCSHTRHTWPISIRFGRRVRPYVVCLDCGRELSYDLAAMRISGPRESPERRADAVEVPNAL